MLLQVILFVIIGIAGGVMGGMGMGGGTLLIPLLTIFAGIEQHLAQAINLCAFLPMSIAALIVHIRNKLIEGKHILIVAIPAAAASVVASLLSRLVAVAVFRDFSRRGRDLSIRNRRNRYRKK